MLKVGIMLIKFFVLNRTGRTIAKSAFKATRRRY